jgi:hypothetical protein
VCWTQTGYAVAAGPAKPHKTASRLGPAAAAATAASPYAGVCAAAEQLFGSIRSTVALQVICGSEPVGLGFAGLPHQGSSVLRLTVMVPAPLSC